MSSQPDGDRLRRRHQLHAGHAGRLQSQRLSARRQRGTQSGQIVNPSESRVPICAAAKLNAVPLLCAQVIQLPKNSVTLYGNQSTDDHDNLSYEWSLSPESKDKVVEMQVGCSAAFKDAAWLQVSRDEPAALFSLLQGVRTPILQLSAMQEGDYTFQLTVTDSAGQQDTAHVTVIVQPGRRCHG